MMPSTSTSRSLPNLCANQQCEFFGNPKFNGYCSACYKILPPVPPAPPVTTYIKKITGVTPRIRLVSTAKGLKSEKFIEELLKDVPTDAKQDLKFALRTLGSLIQHSLDNNDDFEKIQETIQETIQKSYRYFWHHIVNCENSKFDGVAVSLKELTIDVFEKCITKRYHCNLFSPSQDQQADKDMVERFEQLKWLCPSKHLKISVDVYNAEVRQYIFKAVNALESMDGFLDIVEKLNCIVNCWKIITDYLEKVKPNSSDADNLMSIVVFVILQTRPKQLCSNINYIQRYRFVERADTGITAYAFTILCAAVQFIKNSGAKDFFVDCEEYVKYIILEKDYASLWTIVTPLEQNLYLFDEFHKTLPDMRAKSEKVLSDLNKLEIEIKEFRNYCRQQTMDIAPLPVFDIRTPPDIRARIATLQNRMPEVEFVRNNPTLPTISDPPLVRSKPKPKSATFPRFIGKLSRMLSKPKSPTIVTDGEAPIDELDDDVFDILNYSIDQNDETDESDESDGENGLAEGIQCLEIDEIAPDYILSETPVFEYRENDPLDVYNIQDPDDYIDFLCRPCPTDENVDKS